MTYLLPNAKTPALSVPLLSGEQWNLDQQHPDAFTMVVFYRGYHCPVCQQQLEDLQDKLDEFEKLGVKVLGLSMDSKERAQTTYDEWNIKDVPLGYDLDESTARAWGLYMSAKMEKDASKTQEPEVFNEPGLFIIRADGTLYSASIQTMPFARGQFKDVISAIKFIKANNYPARGDLK